jgi:gamma-glutamyltranspeptidase/glutathione hydrolase
LDRPRFCIEDGRASGRVALEEGISPQVMTTLEAMGHSIRPVSGFDRALFGRGQVIVWDKDQGVFWAGSDPRSDGCAMTLT